MKYTVVPEPKKLRIKSEKVAFLLEGGVKISCPKEFETAYDELVTFLFDDLKLVPEDASVGKIEFLIDETIPEEGYGISVTENLVSIFAATSAGAFYAVQTFKQISTQDNYKLCCLEIEDEPELKWRGFMFDSARYFFPKDEIFTLLDIMALHKLNVFHWHLTDDQGWRLELYSRLLLAQIGGFRACTNFNRKPHGGFYSQSDIEQIVAYAKRKHIKIVPEIDMPGHVVSAISAYPSLSCFDRELSVATHSGVKHDVLCVGKESTFEFVGDVWNETIKLFGADFVHLGGDEVPETRWKICPHCQKRMKELGFESENQLHSYFINRVADELNKNGVKTAMWCAKENPQNYNDEVVQMYWGGKGLERDFLKHASGKKIINACSDAYYFDLPYGYISLKDVLDYNPFMSDDVFGVECCLWTEYVPDMMRAEKLLFPRIGAFCETAWNGRNKISYEEFSKKLDAYCFFITAYGFVCTKIHGVNPGKLKGKLQGLWFERRQLHWQGLHNIIDNRKVEKLSKS